MCEDRTVTRPELQFITLCDFFLPQTIDHNPFYNEEELREYEQHLANEEEDINKKTVELQKQREQLERQQEELNAQRFDIQQVKHAAACHELNELNIFHVFSLCSNTFNPFFQEVERIEKLKSQSLKAEDTREYRILITAVLQQADTTFIKIPVMK